MNYKYLFLLIILTVTAYLSQVHAQSNSGQHDIFLKTVFEKGKITGAAITEIRDNTIAGSYHYGLLNANTKKEVTDKSVFEAASLSKPVFASIVFNLEKKGIIDLNKPLITYLPFPELRDERADQLTAFQVLTHTTGLPNWRRQRDTIKLGFTPGEKWSYSGEGYYYLQRVVEHLTRKSLEELAKEYVFDKYDMSNSTFVFNDTTGNYAVSHNKKGSALPKRLANNKGNAAASLHVTAEDYSKFLVGFIQDSSVFRCLEKRIPLGFDKNMFWGIGLGVEVNNSDTIIWHWGNNGGTFRSLFAYSMQRKKGYVLFTNSYYGHSVLRLLNTHFLDMDLALVRMIGGKQIKKVRM